MRALRESLICSLCHVRRTARLTSGVCIGLQHQGTLVAVHASYINADMAALIDAAQDSPESVAQQAFGTVEAGEIEVLADERSRSSRRRCYAITS